jgi:hypothetical protein
MPATAETAVTTYLEALRYNRQMGVKETSNYPALEHLFNEVGKKLQVRCIIHPKNKGAGIPDGGLFTANQFKVALPEDIRMRNQQPERGAIEAKGTDEDVIAVAHREQVTRYLQQYGQVLVTNCYDFQLVVMDTDGAARLLERFRLAESESEFWRAAQHPQQLAAAKGAQFTEYLQRVMLHPAPLTRAQDVAWFLASYAREARARIEQIELPALEQVRKAMEEALGMQFTGERGEHFFRSTLIQTLFYGLFSAWVLWCRTGADRQPNARFDWRVAGWYLHVPMVNALYNQLVNPQQLGPLGLVEVLDWTGETLNRVDRNRFFASFDAGQAVQYFYEPFLEAYDPELREQLGVWYTPGEIIEYMVERVDRALRSELNIADGLADPNVYVLDPCCGTGGYLVAVLKRIAKTLQARGGDALTAHDIKSAATSRVFGFEILPAPFVVAHLQLGLLLQQLGAPIASENNERAAVYLTNALTGWEPPDPAKEQYVQRSLAGMPELAVERDAARHVKQEKPILVILGNPPYNAFAGTSPEEENGLVEPYKQGLISEWGIKKFNLDELYARFFRLAERKVAEMNGRGIVCYISNYSWVADPSYVVLRRHLLTNFDAIWIDNMHGDRNISEYAPDGRTSETIFAIPGFSPGIKQGTAISLWIKAGDARGDAQVYFRNDLQAARATDRRAELLASLLDPDLPSRYERAQPSRENRYSFRPSNVAAHYREWPLLSALAQEASNGLMEKRSGALMDVDKDKLACRMRMYYDRDVTWEELTALKSGLTDDAAGYEPEKARKKLQGAEIYKPESIRRYAVRPFETRWCYYSGVSPLWNRSRPSLWAQCWEGNGFVLSRMKGTASPEGVPMYFVSGLSDDHLLMADAVCFPIRLHKSIAVQVNTDTAQNDLFAAASDIHGERTIANLSAPARTYLAEIGAPDPDTDAASAALIWMHALATGFASAYLAEHADGIRENWPRVPLPANLDQLQRSAALGSSLASLLDTEQAITGITTGPIRPELAQLGNLTVAGNRPLDLESGDLDIRAGWGHAGRDGITMPGKGKLSERGYYPEERAALTAAGLHQEQILTSLGQTTYDIFLNDHVYWKNIPTRIWNYHIGGYQVIKKWLSYRQRDLLGRSLTPEEAREVTTIIRRIAAILILEPELDASYRATTENVYSWPALEPSSGEILQETPL